jgi:hypothetical protein
MDNFIQEYQNVLSDYECDYIINWFESNENLQKPGEIGTGIVDKNKKLSIDIHMNFLQEPSDINLILFNAIASNSQNYRKKYPQIDKYIHSWSLKPEWNIQKYLPNQAYYATHCESTSKENSYRVMAWMIYLNSIIDGGGTNFPQYNKTIIAEKGKLVLWPAYWTHLHHGVCSKTEIKYIATGWFCFT